ncbi:MULTISPECIES: acyltransferase [Emticicia]|uniref:acyltransferase family protein n=1 Tax=Emticicia TaxID=312278 RepID=UPI0007D8B814|nr:MULTISPECIES: acyltransferase [Emticicia]
MTQSTSNTSYLKQLDGLRFLAVTMVLVDHWSGDMLQFPISYLGVCMFFVLSGFLITRILLQSKQKDEETGGKHNKSIKKFFIRRTIRIFPIYYLTILVLFLLNIEPVREKIWWYLTYSTNIYIAIKQTWLGSSDHLWSLAVEEQFYLFFPFIVFFISSKILPKVLWGFIFLSVGLRLFFYLNETAWMTPYVLTPTCLDAFGMGGLLAYFYFHKSEKLKQIITNKIWLMISLLLYIGIVIWGKQFPEGHNIITVVFLRLFESLFSLFFVGNAVYGFEGTTKKILENRAFVYIGRISYGIYIYHKFIYNHYHNSPANPVVKLLNKLPLIEQNMTLKIIFLYLITIAVATVSWYIIEKPINNLKEKFNY